MFANMCNAIRSDGLPCRNRPVKGSHRCRWHQEPKSGFRVTIGASEDELERWLLLHAQYRAREQQNRSAHRPDVFVVEFGEHVQCELRLHDGERMLVRAPKLTFPTTFFPIGTHACCMIGHERIPVLFSSDQMDQLIQRNSSINISPPVCDGAASVCCRSQTLGCGSPAIATSIPHCIIQVTSEEPRAMIEAIACARNGDGWRRERGGTARVYTSRSGRHEVWLDISEESYKSFSQSCCATKLSASARRDGKYAILEGEEASAPEEWFSHTLASWDLDAAFLVLVVLGTLADVTLKHASSIASMSTAPVVDLAVDDILQAIGKTYPGSKELFISRRGFNSVEEHNEWRKWVRHQLLLISNMVIVGRRRGTYRNQLTRTVKDTYREDCLFHVVDRETEWEGNRPIVRGDGVPVRLRIHGGGLFRDIASNKLLLQYIGDLSALASISTGKASGQWARAIGLAFAQITRERYSKLRRAEAYCRRELLNRFPPAPCVQDLVDSSNPRRILQYWSNAIDELERIGWIVMREDPAVPERRYGWHEDWLAQDVLMSPGPALRTEMSLNPTLQASRRC